MPLGFVAAEGPLWCNNCFSIPDGVGWDFGTQDPGPTTTWTAVSNNKGVHNLRNPWLDGDATATTHRNSATLTFDQQVAQDFLGIGMVGIFVDAFWSNRRNVAEYTPPGGNSAEAFMPSAGMTIPTNNPYRPTGAPANIRIHYNLAVEAPTRTIGAETSARYAFGFNFDDLPFGWHGRLFYSRSEDENQAYYQRSINRNMVSAALGNTVPSQAARGNTPSQGAFTKPATVPYLNVFCDPLEHQCNSPVTIAYVSGYRRQWNHWLLQEFGGTFDGPIWDLPGGTILGAIGANYINNSYVYNQHENGRTHNTSLIATTILPYADKRWAVFGQLNVPIFGENFSFPMMEALTLEFAYRYDWYDIVPAQYTPKIAGNWEVGYGLSFRGAWGKSHRVPGYGELREFFGTRDLHLPINFGGGSTLNLNCAAVPGISGSQGVAQAGSLTALLNPTCSPALQNPGGINLSGSPLWNFGQTLLSPKSAEQWNVSVNYAPTFLPGLVLDATYFKINITDNIANFSAGTGPNDPASISRYPRVINNPNLPITDPANAEFLAEVNRFLATAQAGFTPDDVPNIKFILDTGPINIGTVQLTGMEFDVSYDLDLGNWGTWSAGASGYYEFDQYEELVEGGPREESYLGQNSGHRLHRARFRLGWTDGMFNATLSANYRGHSGEFGHSVPACFWDEGFGPGSCYPGSQYFPHDTDGFTTRTPSTYLFDLSVGYDTGMNWTNPYLHNISLQFAVNNLFNRTPPFTPGGSRPAELAAFSTEYHPNQRVVSITVTKNW
jgi:outer membrane receptor protein involved in Fe transport